MLGTQVFPPFKFLTLQKGRETFNKKEPVLSVKCVQNNELAQLKDRFIFYESMEKLLGGRGIRELGLYRINRISTGMQWIGPGKERSVTGWNNDVNSQCTWITPTACSIFGPAAFYNAVSLVPSHHYILRECWLVMLKIAWTSCSLPKQTCLRSCQWNKAVLEDCGHEDNWYSSFFFFLIFFPKDGWI